MKNYNLKGGPIFWGLTNKKIVLELQNPIVEGNNVSFKIKILQGTAPKEFKATSIFIDPM
jgi:hypothetical protein